MKNIFIIFFIATSFHLNLKGEDTGLIGFAVDYGKSSEESSLNVGFTMHNYLSGETNNFTIDYFIGGVTWLPEDKYNDNKKNVSYFGLYSYAGMLVMSPIVLITSYDTTIIAGIAGAMMLCPTLLTNSRIGYSVYKNQISSNSRFTATIFFRTKLDYFNNQSNHFARYNPALGLELGLMYKGYGIFLSSGGAYPIDFVYHTVKTSNIIPNINLKIAIGSLRKNDPKK